MYWTVDMGVDFLPRDAMHRVDYMLLYDFRPSVSLSRSGIISNWVKMVKMVNGSRYYRALESVSIASALSSALTIYPCQIRVHQR